jgi:hypothetical protein
MITNQDKTSTLKQSALSKPLVSKMVNGNKLKPKKKPPIKLILGGLLLALLVVGSGAALYLTQMNQDVRQQAAGSAPYCGDGECQNPDNPCQCTADCGVPAGGCNGGPVPIVLPDGGCVGVNCTPPDGGCVATHHCDEIWDNGECTVLSPDVTTNSVNAQEEANRSCKCVQVDVLTGGSGSCDNGHINGDWSTLIGSSVVCPNVPCNSPIIPPIDPPVDPPIDPSNPPTTPPTNPPTTPPTDAPSPSPVAYFCNSNCENDRQCKTAGTNLVCSDGKCRLDSNPTNEECRPAVGPMCLDVDLVSSQTGVILTEDPSYGDTVKFTCSNVAGVDHYSFRVIEPDSTVVNLQATGMTSEAYTISKDGKHFAQCQICTTEDDLSCYAYEALN